MRHTLSLAWVSLLVLGLMACSSADPTATHVQTVIHPETVAVGGSTTVTCAIIDSHGGELEGETTFTVEPSEGVAVDGERITADVAGTYTVRCEAPDVPLVDETGVILTVGAGDAVSNAAILGDAVSIAAVLEESVIEVHQTTEVLCVVSDSLGNTVEVEAVVSSPDEDVDVTDHTVGSEEVGTYEVFCDLTGEAAGTLQQV
ncbi:MAG: hypothetical protein QF464_01505, partial [Myxococcota bacterium]|nr:hypothetical protein [Myxococcota bacterium]